MTVRSTFRASLITPCVLGSVLAVPSAAFAQTGISMSGATPAAGPTASQAPAVPPAAASGSGAAPAPGVPSSPAPAPAPAPAPVTQPASATPAPLPMAGAVPVDSAQTPSGETDSDAEWIQRERALGEPTTLVGATGLLKTQHAETGAPGQFRLGFVGEWFSASFLCTSSFPCPNPNGGTAITSDTLDHSGGTLSLGVSLAKLGAGTLDVYGAITAYANSDGASKPALLQVLGDTTLGLKYVAPVGKVLHLGAFSELWLINGTGAVGLDGSGTSAKFGGIATADLRELDSQVPLRFSANVVYSLDNTGDVLAATEAARGAPVSRVERYGLGVNRVDHIDFYAGGEVFLANEMVRPFVETRIVAYYNRQGYVCVPQVSGSDHCVANDSVVPATLTLGGRFFPWHKGFSLLAALDIGIGGTNDFVEELQPIPPWTLYLGAGWAVDTSDRPPVVHTKFVEKATEKTARARVVGFVHEKDKTEPIPDAVVSYRDHADMSPLATAPDGKFGDDVPAGQYTFDIKADGFKATSCDASVPPELGTVAVDCALEALPRVGTVIAHVHDALTGQPIPSLQITLTDPQRKELRVTSDPGGNATIAGVAPGTSELTVIANGYLVLVTPVDVKVRQDSQVDLLLRPKPQHSNVEVRGHEVTIKQQIQFALDSAVILPESFGLLTEIADTMIRDLATQRVEVQGHTDNSGSPDHNKTLSEQRAEAVRLWLVQHGVVADRLVSRGYGQEKPLVPNTTTGNRSRNRRVQFIILDADSATPGPAGGDAAGPKGHTERKKSPLPGF